MENHISKVLLVCIFDMWEGKEEKLFLALFFDFHGHLIPDMTSELDCFPIHKYLTETQRLSMWLQMQISLHAVGQNPYLSKDFLLPSAVGSLIQFLTLVQTLYSLGSWLNYIYDYSMVEEQACLITFRKSIKKSMAMLLQQLGRATWTVSKGVHAKTQIISSKHQL